MGVVSPFVARWDLDKTYLRTDFDTPGDLLRTALERPDQKRSVPGAAAVLRELGKAGGYIHILSGSPRQMRRNLEEKLRIDRVRWDALTLKPNLSNFFRLRFRAMRDQLGYKLPELLEGRVHVQPQSAEIAESTLPPEVLVGDDAEADAFVYSLYADVCAGAVDSQTLGKVLDAGGSYPDRAERTSQAAHQIVRGPAVRRILIHLDRQSPPSAFKRYGSRVVPFYNYFQAALILVGDRFLEPVAALRVANAFVTRFGFDQDSLRRSYQELSRRHPVPELAGTLKTSLKNYGQELSAESVLTQAVHALEDAPETGARVDEALDYVALAKEHRGGKNRKHRLRASR